MLVFYFVSDNIYVGIIHVDVCHLFSSIEPSYFKISSFSFSRSRFLLLTFSLFSSYAMEKTLFCTVCVCVCICKLHARPIPCLHSVRLMT
jgi:hypothetical protein